MLSYTYTKTTWVRCLLATAALLIAPASAAADGHNPPEGVTGTEVESAVTSVPGLAQQSEGIGTVAETDSEYSATGHETRVSVPRTSENPATVAFRDMAPISITMPGTGVGKNRSRAERMAPGVFAYPGSGPSANAAQINDNGSLRLLTVIENKKAPTSYRYPISVPDGGEIRVVAGGAVVLDKAQAIVAMIDKPWAKDAKGGDVPTWFEVDGSTLVQYVAHRAGKTAYPVVADPVVLGVYITWWTATRIAACTGGWIWGWISGGGNRWDQRAYQAFIGCASALGLRYLFR